MYGDMYVYELTFGSHYAKPFNEMLDSLTNDTNCMYWKKSRFAGHLRCLSSLRPSDANMSKKNNNHWFR